MVSRNGITARETKRKQGTIAEGKANFFNALWPRSVGTFSRRTNQTQEAQVYSHDGPMKPNVSGVQLYDAELTALTIALPERRGSLPMDTLTLHAFIPPFPTASAAVGVKRVTQHHERNGMHCSLARIQTGRCCTQAPACYIAASTRQDNPLI
eukprot:6063416-Pyramimonas_sp.AAC.1